MTTRSRASVPGIVMVPEWWGITKHIHDEAQKFAQQGYTAFIADMYGDGKTADNPKDAGALAGRRDEGPEGDGGTLQRRADQLGQHASVDPTRIGAVGYCFGGAVVLNMARAGADLAAVTGFHASLGLNTPAPAPGAVKAKILVLNGADDPFVKREEYESSRRTSTRRRLITGSSSIRARCTPSLIPKPPSSAKKFNLPLRVRCEGGPRGEGRGGEVLCRQPPEIAGFAKRRGVNRCCGGRPRGRSDKQEVSMTLFRDRERAFEQVFVHDEEARFRALARRNKLLGQWAAAQLGLAGDQADAYVNQISSSVVAAVVDEGLVEKLRADFQAGGVDQSDDRIGEKMSELMAVAMSQVRSSNW